MVENGLRSQNKIENEPKGLERCLQACGPEFKTQNPCPEKPDLVRQRQADPWGLLTSLHSLRELLASERPCVKAKVHGTRGMTTEVVLWFLCDCTHVYKYIHAHQN